MTGRPFRFLAAALAGWTGVRTALLWPTIDSVPALIRAVAPPAMAAAYGAIAERPPAPTTASPPRITRPPASPTPMSRSPAERPAPPPPEGPAPEALEPTPLRLPPLPGTLATPPPASRRLAVSLWAVARQGLGEPRPGSQLGGSQAGLRVTYALDGARRLALAARLSAALDGSGKEAALGLDWQPAGRALHLVAEQRIALGAGRGGPAVFAVAGLDPAAIGGGWRVEAYGQAGGVLRGRVDPFADGAARVTRTVASAGGLRLDLGLGAWGGAQRGAARLDIGPGAGIVVPIGPCAIRVTLDWRQRIAGDARPGSGPALAIGTGW